LPPEVLDGILVALLAAAAGAAELIDKQPEFISLVFRSRAGRRYLLVNVLAGGLAYAAALLLDVQFREPQRPILILTCGLTAIAVLRSAAITHRGFAGPARMLQSLQDAYTLEFAAEAKVRGWKAADGLTEGLTWDVDALGLVTICLVIEDRFTPEQIEQKARLIKRISETDLGDDALRLNTLAVALRREFGHTVLHAAAKTLKKRHSKTR